MAFKQRITNCIWFNDNGKEAAELYTSIFPDSHIGDITHYTIEGADKHHHNEGTVLTVEFTLSGLEFLALNGGPEFKINPSISYFVICETQEELDNTWNKLLQGGNILMPLDKYDWSEKYGWVQDKFGLSWQLSLGKLADVGQKITPSLLFTDNASKAEEAINFYTSIFKRSAIDGILKYAKEDPKSEGYVKHAQFSLDGQKFMVMASGHQHSFKFNEGVSLMIICQSQEEIDYFWDKLTAGGKEVECGWLKDKYDVTWQVTPIQLMEMQKSPDKERVARVTKTYMQMKKFDLQKLEEVFRG